MQVVQQFGPSVVEGSVEQLGDVVTGGCYFGLQLHVFSFQLVYFLVELTVGLPPLSLKLGRLFDFVSFFYEFFEVVVFFGEVGLGVELFFEFLEFEE